MDTLPTYTAFANYNLLVSGPIEDVLAETKKAFDRNDGTTLLVFDDRTGKQVDFDFEGTPDEVVKKLGWHPMFGYSEILKSLRGPGRPKLGVVSREISLLPRHWEWLEQQPQGASAALRRLVDEARKKEPEQERARRAREAAGNFMWAMAGNLANFEEASRALYAGDRDSLDRQIEGWPEGVKSYVVKLLDVD
jgi:hypothetical protein